MIKAIILDIDGVIVGDKQGFNFPDPHSDVIQKMRELRHRGIPISLCTAKPSFAIKKIIDMADLHNVHITDGGAIIIDPIDNVIVKKHIINNEIAKKLLSFYYENNIYQEIFNTTSYYIKKSQKSEITVGHAKIIQREPEYIDNIENFASRVDIIKLFIIVKDEKEKLFVIDTFNTYFKNDLTLSWTQHPTMLPLQFGIITSKGISKRQGAIEISQALGIPLKNILAVGDTVHDWQFIEICGYGGVMGNGTEELKRLVNTKDKGHFYIGKSVNENGVLDIFHHFSL